MRLGGLMSTFGGLTPMNVWEMRFADFVLLAYVIDHPREASSDG